MECSQSHYCRRSRNLWSLCMTLLFRLHVGVAVIRIDIKVLNISSSSTFISFNVQQQSTHLTLIEIDGELKVLRQVISSEKVRPQFMKSNLLQQPVVPPRLDWRPQVECSLVLQRRHVVEVASGDFEVLFDPLEGVTNFDVEIELRECKRERERSESVSGGNGRVGEEM